jgi:putative flippase GtrA
MVMAKRARDVLNRVDSGIAALARRGISPDFLRFGIVGTLGFCWDTGTVYGLRGRIGLYAAGLAGFLVASTANWLTNRIWTFRDRAHSAAHVQWLRYVVANLGGFVLNRGSFFILISISLLCRRQPVFAIIAGSLAGLGLNYFLSKRFVFR